MSFKMWSNLFFLITIVSLACSKPKYKYETKWFTVPLDHFSYQRNETFQMKYLVNEDYWDHQGVGPIFFYTGNEGQIETFAEHSGFIWDIAPQYKAKIVFAEHRYYGASMPFPNNKSMDNAHIGYLTAEQALADYADLVNFLQGDFVRPRYPVIAFGGSYGGMLSAYFRMKYPHLVTGAIAASAPVHMFPGMADASVFNTIVTSSFTRANAACSDNIRHSWSVIRNYTSTKNGSEWLQKTWKLCDPITNTSDTNNLVNFLTDMYVTLAMVNYPFPCDFLLPLPAYPVRVVCQELAGNLTGEPLLEAIGKALQIYSNYEKKNDCVKYKNGDQYQNLDAAGWDYQACTQMVMPISATGTTDMFEPSPWNFTEYSEDCHKKYNVYPSLNEARIRFGGGQLQAASNIVFSNGFMDPWTAGGILNNLSDSVRAVLIPDGAHHLDLMASNPADPDTVTAAREIHKQNINNWINEFGYQQKHAKY